MGQMQVQITKDIKEGVVVRRGIKEGDIFNVRSKSLSMDGRTMYLLNIEKPIVVYYEECNEILTR